MSDLLTASGKRVTDVRDEGFTTLWENTEAPVIADIVLIHGLQGHPKKTWLFGTYESPRKQPPSKSYWSLLKSSMDDTKFCYWPEDLLPNDFPGCRILTYGYDAHVSRFFHGGTNQASIIDHARGFLNGLHDIREEAADRPIIFISHSLGGLILKEALRQSWESRLNLNAVVKSTIATIFMGTPHGGSELASKGLGLATVTKFFGFDTSDVLLRDLKVESTMLDIIAEGFARVLEAEQFYVFTFRESRNLGIPFALNKKVVSKASSRVGYAQEMVDFINADHRDMCRFPSRLDQGYQKVKGAIKRSLQIHNLAAYNDSRGIHSGEFKALIDDLYTQEASFRLGQIEPAFKNTFKWIYSNESLGFQKWLESDAPLFWIRGKPASGKSTLMKMIYCNTRTAAFIQKPGRKSSFAGFFFHDRGSYIQKSLEGLLKGTLHKILNDIPELKAQAFQLYSAAPRKEGFAWDVENLIQLFRRVVLQEEHVITIFLCLDALDEYFGPQKDMVKFILDACSCTSKRSKTRIKVCFSSRPEQLFLDSFDAVPGISIHEHTTDDIRNVVDQEFKANPRMADLMSRVSRTNVDGVERIRSRILSSAKGVFLWVRLILAELLDDFTAGHSLNDLYEKLESLPNDLNTFYAYLIAKKIPQKYARKTRIMFDLLLCSIRPMSLVQFMTAFRLADLADLDYHPTDTMIDLDETERLIRSISGGLIEVRSLTPLDQTRRPLENTTSKMEVEIKEHPESNLSSHEVQFLHQTVKTFARKSLEQSSQINHFGHVSLLKVYLYFIRLSKASHIKGGSAEELLQYLQFADSRTQASQFALLRQVPISQLSEFLRTASSRIGLGTPDDLVKVTILAKAQWTLANLIDLQASWGQYWDYMNSVEERESNSFRYFCKCYLSNRSSYGDPAEIIDILLRRNWGQHAIWNGLFDFMNAQRGIVRPQRELNEAIVKITEKALKLRVNPDYVLRCHDSCGHVAAASRNISGQPQHNPEKTYLINAVIMSNNPTPVIRLLLDHKANLCVKDEKGATPLKHAIDAYIYAAINVIEGRGLPESAQEYYARFDTARLLVDSGGTVVSECPVRCLLIPDQSTILDELGYPTDKRFEMASADSRLQKEYIRNTDFEVLSSLKSLILGILLGSIVYFLYPPIS